ncbi:MAG: tRNA (N6-threonylcarbamoyladenosine(37)-N6)-methyltransferase TrmO [Actinomycetota bacterium]|jgi:tRNA-Thr(GGU) m(6)t(6)A37 methyltransferase TsaA|nr:tRNA (N6-threonylcarbamoyladenosine(37)-N6)-methyltransferase TrmO [Actinomycetota bacterium]
MKKYEIIPIGEIKTPFKSRNDAPRQPLYSKGAEGTIEIFKEYSPGLEGIENFKYIIVIFYFDRNNFYKLKTIPYGSENERGIFSTRSPHRPNNIGLSVLELLGIKENKLKVKDVDMLDKTPVIDIKPYIPEIDIRKYS